MEATTGTPLLELKNLNGETSINNPHLMKFRKSVVINPLIRAVRRGLRTAEKFLSDQKDIEKLQITDADITGRNIFHLSVQREELLEFLLDKFKKHENLIQALHGEDMNGHTPAHIAVLHNERKSMHMLAEVDKNVYTIRSSKTGQTLIHCAVESCNLYIVQDILETRPDALYDKDMDGESPQHYAAALEEYFLLEYLLSQGADIFETDKNESTPLHFAAAAGSIANVKLLVLDEEDLSRSEDNLGRSALHIACMKGNRNIVAFLLENGADPLVKEKDGLNCLELAVANKQDGVVKELLLSNYWRELIEAWKGGAKRCFAHLVDKMPDNAKILLDRCVVKSDDKRHSLDYNITYDFFLLEPTGSKFYGLEAITENNEEQCLTHNLCRKYFSVKWREKGCYLYLANLFLYLCFHVLFNVYVALVRGAIARRVRHPDEVNTTVSTKVKQHPTAAASPDEPGPIIATVVIVTVTIFNVIKEFIQMHQQRWRYFKQVSNYFEWTLYVCVMVFMFPVRKTKTEDQFGAAAIAVCISWFNLIWFLRRIPDIGTYILTLQKVFKTLVKMLLLIVLFCMAFASTFYLLFAEQDRFVNYPIAVLSTFVSMLGDFAYDDLFVEVGIYKDFHTFKLVMFVVFVLLMVVVVNNVLIGLAVGDTEYVMNMAKVQRLRQHMKFIIEVETSIFSRLPCFKKKNKTLVHIEYPNHTKSWRTSFNRLLAGEMNTFYNVEESDEEDDDEALTQEKVEEIVQARLENYHKRMIQELKDFHVDIVEKLGDMVN
ncbi:transient receptor potential cation channel subfamily A member 1-like isoform X2 [Dendronephthya gigantea]|nr:transient receptor potential cation channel subfamily A member 1-like isoform X2 [Dendronephthya gigantea]XP_028406995.1 transient receptor potential cation channel subfamily A member 1-like isoform X2 [Dendronephthya gigantea]XP_028406996.1 transient receptor potential cation channel subfamily A member 1-like isoform X2 [Dendronephthya gigantea]